VLEAWRDRGVVYGPTPDAAAGISVYVLKKIPAIQRAGQAITDDRTVPDRRDRIATTRCRRSRRLQHGNIVDVSVNYFRQSCAPSGVPRAAHGPGVIYDEDG